MNLRNIEQAKDRNLPASMPAPALLAGDTFAAGGQIHVASGFGDR